MAFGIIKNTEEVAFSSTRFIGIAPVKIIALNPNKEELSSIYEREIDTDPVYVSEVEYTNPINEQKKQVKQIKLDFYLKNEELGFITKVTFFLMDTPWVSKQGKCKVIDEYGRTAWVSQEEYKTKSIPQYANGPARISSNYKVCYRNEEELVQFLKYYFGIPEVDRYENSMWIERDDKEQCIAMLEKIKDYFNNDVSEIKDMLKIATKNKIKVLLGVRQVEGKTYQDVYNRYFMRNNSTSIKAIEKNVKEAQEAGAYPNTIFEFNEVSEYKAIPQPTQSTPSAVTNPFGASTTQEQSASFTAPTNNTAFSGISDTDLPF